MVGGVDTHRDTHVGAVVDTAGRLLGSAQFRADTGLCATGGLDGVAGSDQRGRGGRDGSYGAGLSRHLGAGIDVVEVNRPNRQLRRQRGKDDNVDAEAAARAALSGEATAVPKSGDGPVEWIRMLTVVRRSAVKARTQAANQFHSLGWCPRAPKSPAKRYETQSTGPSLRPVPTQRRVLCQLRQAGSPSSSPPLPDTQRRDRRTRHRDQTPLRQGQPGVQLKGIGPNTAATLLVAAGDNPKRMKSERSFAALWPRPSVVWPNSSAPSQPGRQPASQQRTLADSHHPDAHRRCHQRLRHPTPGGGQETNRDHPMPQTAHRPRDLPDPHHPATNPELRETTQRTPTSRYNRHRGRPSYPNPPQPHLSTRARPRPQPPARYPIPTLAHPTTDLHNIGAS